MKKILSMVSILALTGTSLLSSVSADESAETNENTSVSSTESESTDSKVTTTQTTQEAPTPTLYNGDQNGAATGTVTVMPVTTPSSTSPIMNADRNNDGSVDMYEQCAFVQKKSEESCSSAKETMKKKMWEQYGSGAYNPNAFERNQNHGIIMKKMNEKNRMERKEVKQEIKDVRKEVKVVRKALSEKLHGQLIQAIEKLSVEKLNRVLTNIDKAVAKVTTSSLSQEKKDRLLAQLEEIRVIIQDKVAVLTGSVSEGNILTDILSGTTDTTPASTSTGATDTATGTTNTATGTVTQ